MRNRKKVYTKKVSIIIAIIAITFIASIIVLQMKNNNVKQIAIQARKDDLANVDINKNNGESETINVLVIEINPILTSITDKNIYVNNEDGHPKVSEYLQGVGKEETALQEMINDLEQASHGYVNIETTREYLNEFPTYKSQITLSNGTKANRFDEDTYLEMIKYNGNTVGTYAQWMNIWNSEYNEQIPAYNFDYDYLIDKFNLVERRNNGEFDQVWLLTVDPSRTFEIMMVGRTAYWLNGTANTKDCDNFIVAAITIARRDANLHAFGHGIESIMKDVFTMSYDAYAVDKIDVTLQENYDSLNLWEKFNLTEYNSIGDRASVGNVHFPFNATDDYDYSNTNNVNSNWQAWEHYPDLTMQAQPSNNLSWKNHPINTILGSNDNKDPDRLYMRFWFSLFPHIEGYTSDGYFNNWWKYICSLDYVESITNEDSISKDINIGDEVLVNCKLTYQSKKTKTITEVEQGNNIQISNTEVINFEDGKLKALSSGQSTLTLNYDGKKIEYKINVLPNVLPDEEVHLSENQLTMRVGQTKTLIATVTSESDRDKELIWEHTGHINLTTSPIQNGEKAVINAVEEEEATVRVYIQDGDSQDSCSIKVIGNKPTLHMDISTSNLLPTSESEALWLQEKSHRVYLQQIIEEENYEYTLNDGQSWQQCNSMDDKQYGKIFYIDLPEGNYKIKVKEVGTGIESIYYYCKIDGTAPAFNLISENNIENNEQVVIKIIENLSGLKTNNIQYIFSTSTTAPREGYMTATVENNQVTLTSDISTGENYYLYIKAVQDNAGNIGEDTVFGPYSLDIDTTPPRLSVDYSTTQLTNQNVLVTISSNEPVQSVPGWILSSNKLELKKEYESNTLENGEIVEVKDLAGNTAEITIKITNIDKTSPTLTVTYTEDVNKQYVIATIKSSEKIQQVEGWTISSDLTSLTKKYTINDVEKITVYDLAGNSSSIDVEVNTIIEQEDLSYEIKYSTTKLTNEDVIVTITFNNEISNVEGWQLSEDKKVLTKTYTDNDSETITVYDLNNNSADIEIEVNNIDKIAPQLDIKYDVTESPNKTVVVTITSNERIQQVEGWTLSDDEKTLIKTYTANDNQTIEIYDLAGNSTQAVIQVTGLENNEPPTPGEGENPGGGTTTPGEGENPGGDDSKPDNNGKPNSNPPTNDNTTSPNELPNTGAMYVGILIGITLIIVIVSYKKFRDLKYIK